jgi:hypothetical protein
MDALDYKVICHSLLGLFERRDQFCLSQIFKGSFLILLLKVKHLELKLTYLAHLLVDLTLVLDDQLLKLALYVCQFLFIN